MIFSRYVRILEKQTSLDENEVVAMVDEKQRFLMCALENYLMCLQRGQKYDMRVFRLTSLWFDNNTTLEANILMEVEAHIVFSSLVFL